MCFARSTYTPINIIHRIPPPLFHQKQEEQAHAKTTVPISGSTHASGVPAVRDDEALSVSASKKRRVGGDSFMLTIIALYVLLKCLLCMASTAFWLRFRKQVHHGHRHIMTHPRHVSTFAAGVD